MPVFLYVQDSAKKYVEKNLFFKFMQQKLSRVKKTIISKSFNSLINENTIILLICFKILFNFDNLYIILPYRLAVKR